MLLHTGITDVDELLPELLGDTFDYVVKIDDFILRDRLYIEYVGNGLGNKQSTNHSIQVFVTGNSIIPKINIIDVYGGNDTYHLSLKYDCVKHLIMNMLNVLYRTLKGRNELRYTYFQREYYDETINEALDKINIIKLRLL